MGNPPKAARKKDAAAETPPSRARVSRSDYETALEAMQLELNRAARWIKQTGQRVVVVLEGRDTAGKSGVINAITQRLNPRQTHVAALPAPSEAERSQWYFQRYVAHLPSGGHLTLFDRSWYNRAGVEKVMGFCTDEEYRRFLVEAPLFEKSLVNDGVIVLKYWLTVDQAEQEARFAERLADPLKRWKLSPIDVQAREQYAEYGLARDAMLKATHTRWAPWTLVDFNDQRTGRLTLIRHLLDHLPDQPTREPRLRMPALKHPPLTEQFGTRQKPLRPWQPPRPKG